MGVRARARTSGYSTGLFLIGWLVQRTFIDDSPQSASNYEFIQLK